MKDAKWKAAVQGIFVLAAAAALKLHYSMATADELRWVLWPTARLTEFATGTRFAFEPFAGYLSDDRSFLIAAPCAGVNFLIAAFLTVSIRRLWRSRRLGVKWRHFLFAAVIAYLLTIVANTVRISSALWLNKIQRNVAGLGRDEIHRIDGILIYFGFLLLLFWVCEKADKRHERFRFRHYLFPLSIYYAVTLAVPFANGAFRQGSEFWQHAGFVFATPIVLLLAAALPLELFSRHTQRKDVSAALLRLPANVPADDVRP